MTTTTTCNSKKRRSERRKFEDPFQTSANASRPTTLLTHVHWLLTNWRDPTKLNWT